MDTSTNLDDGTRPVPKTESRESPSRSKNPKDPKDQQVGDIVKELNIARKNISMYPPSHKQVQASLARAYQMLQQVLQADGAVSLGVAKRTLLVADRELDEKNVVYAEFAAALSRFDLAGITFSRGLGREELFDFLRVLSNNPEDIESGGGVETILSTHYPAKNIRLQTIDYSKVRVTEEQEIDAQGNPGKSTEDAVWQDFIRLLLANRDNLPKRGWSAHHLGESELKELTELINNYEIDVQPAAEYYESVLSGCLREPVDDSNRSQADRFDCLVRLNHLIKGIHPELRKQFLEANLRQCAAADSPSRVEAFLGSFPDDLVLDILKQTNQTRTEISPSLMRLIEGISKTREINLNELETESADPGNQIRPEGLSSQDVSTLFHREDYDAYVASDYNETLKVFAGSLDKRSGPNVDGFSVDEYEQTLEDDHIEYQIVRALLAIMDEDVTKDEYQDCCNRVMSANQTLLAQGRFSFLLTVFATLNRHSKEKSGADIRTVAQKALESFSARPFVSSVVTCLKTEDEATAEGALELLAALGAAAVPDLLRMYCVTKSDVEEKRFFNMLIRMGPVTFDEVRRRLADPATPFAHRLVKLLCRADGREIVQDLKRLRQNENPQVQEEIVKGLIQFKDPEGISMLRKLLHDKDGDIRRKAVALAGAHRVEAVTEDLAAIMKRVPLFKSHFEFNEAIIDALGRIGDPRAVPVLEKLARSHWIPNKKRLAHMKEVLFESLSGYPYESIAKLVHMGTTVGSYTIRSTCMKIAAKKAT